MATSPSAMKNSYRPEDLTAETAAFCAANWWPALFMPAIAMLLASLFLERVFQKYAPELAGQDEEE